MPMAGLDRPPSPSPDIQSQQGQPQQTPPGAGLGQLAGQKGGAPAPGAPDPNGAVVSQVEAIKRVLEQVASTEPVMAPFAARATAILDAGVSAVRSAPKAPQGGGDTGPPNSQGMPPPPGGPGQMPPLG